MSKTKPQYLIIDRSTEQLRTFPAANATTALNVLAERHADVLRERDRLREALAFARSVIRSGEPWTETCERVISGALEDQL